MQDQHVAVRVVQEGHEADTGVDGLAEELDPGLLELPTRRGYVGDTQRDPGRGGLEGLAVRLG